MFRDLPGLVNLAARSPPAIVTAKEAKETLFSTDFLSKLNSGAERSSLRPPRATWIVRTLLICGTVARESRKPGAERRCREHLDYLCEQEWIKPEPRRLCQWNPRHGDQPAQPSRKQYNFTRQ